MNCTKLNICLCAVGVAILICIVFNILFDHVVKREYKPIIYRYESSVKIDSVLKDSIDRRPVDILQLVARTDSISNVTSDISRRYQEDVNLMIYKTTQWVTFWLSIMAIVAGVSSVFQYFDKRRLAQELDNMETKLNAYKKETKGELNKRVSDYTNDLNQRVHDLIEREISQVKGQLRDLNDNFRKFDKESRVANLVTCISTFPEPLMFGSSSNRRAFLNYYLKKLHSEYNQYVRCFKDDESPEGCHRLSVVLTSVKYIVIRTQSVYPDYHQNVTFCLLLDLIDKVLIEIIDKGANAMTVSGTLDQISETFGKMVRDIEMNEA